MKTGDHYRATRFLISVHEPDRFPSDGGREVAFVGRSNAGKSSLINALADNRHLARTSRTPGRTQQANFFAVSSKVRLVDLPGYGFARAPAKLRRHWAGLASAYLDSRRSLCGIVLVADVRRLVGEAESGTLEWCRDAGREVHLVLNKADKLSGNAARAALARARKALPGCSVQLFSAVTRAGLEELREVLDAWLFPRS
jgi:GTP-binding protein